ncbi:MAG: SLC13 family permease [Planctomycetota bacterium]|jgi:sodium-dependent dicarboxylate transporter 2/3/5
MAPKLRKPAPAPEDQTGVHLAHEKKKFDTRKIFFLLLGLALFAIMYLLPPLPDAEDPQGVRFVLSPQGKAGLALFLLAATWWVFEVVPIGVTSILIGVVQVLFLIRPEKILEGSGEVLSRAKLAFGDFMDPSVWFILGSITIGMVFTKTGLTKRMAYKMLSIVGERTSMIYLGSFVVTAALTLIMAHTAVAATIYPLLMAIHALYTEEEKPTKFGKGLFIGMAFVAGAGSIITLLGAARGAVAIGFFKGVVGRDISFFQLTYYMAPVGIVMTIVLWLLCLVLFKPERKTIPGLKERAKSLYASLGPLTQKEILTLLIVVAVIVILGAQSFVPEMKFLHKSAVILTATILFFVFKILTIKELEEIPWNIILLFGGAMSIGFCLVETGASKWLAVHWLAMFESAHWAIFVIGIAFFVMVMTNVIMNVAAIAIVMPVALTIAPYLGVAPEVVLFSSLVTAGMPFLFLVGAAPNAIAYESKQFTTGQFFLAGIPASIVLMIVVGFFVLLVWPIMGMPILVQAAA